MLFRKRLLENQVNRLDTIVIKHKSLIGVNHNVVRPFCNILLKKVCASPSKPQAKWIRNLDLRNEN